MNNIFSGLRVLELASVLAGPSVGQFFAELGAEVIKVENPLSNGDVTRSWKSSKENTGDVSAYFSSVNWGKQSITLNYNTETGLNLLYQLVAKSDIIIVSFKPNDANKLKVSFKDLVKIKFDILYGSITGYGANDSRVGYDAVIQAESGFMSINGESDGKPLKLPVALMDILAGHHLKEALLVAYIKKLKTGEGQEVSVSLIDAAMASLANQATNSLVAGIEPKRTGSLHPNIAPYGEVFITKDKKQLLLAVGSDKQFYALCSVLDIELNESFKNNIDRVKNRKALYVLLQTAICQWESKDIIRELNAEHVPCGLVRTIPDALDKYNSLLINHENIAGIRNFAAVLPDNKNNSHFFPPPHVGEHTVQVLSQLLRLNQLEIDELRTLKVIM